MKTVFLDTVGLLALWDESDQWQAAASAAWAVVNVPGTRFVTTPHVLLECGNAAARRRYRSDVCQLRDRLAGNGDLIEPSPAEIEEAWGAYRRDSAGGGGHRRPHFLHRHGPTGNYRRLHERPAFQDRRFQRTILKPRFK